MPWCVTQSMASSASRRSSDRRRTVCTPGITSTPLPVTILKPRESSTSSVACAWRRPEMISASFGSATRQVALNSTTSRTRAPRAMPPATRADSIAVPLRWSHGGDDDGARGEDLHDQHAGAGADVLVVGAVGVERLGAASDRDHDLAYPTGPDVTGDPARLPDQPLVGHRP